MAHANRKKARHLLVNTLLAGAAAVTLLSGALHSVALAEDARIKEIVFEVPASNFPSTINVTSSNGAKWDTIEPGSVMFSAHMKVDTAWPGYVERVGIFLGHCDNLQCGNGYPVLFARLDCCKGLRSAEERFVLHDQNSSLLTGRRRGALWRPDPERLQRASATRRRHGVAFVFEANDGVVLGEHAEGQRLDRAGGS